MTMDPKRRAEVVAQLRDGVRDSISDAQAHWENLGADLSVAACVKEDAAVLEAADELERIGQEAPATSRDIDTLRTLAGHLLNERQPSRLTDLRDSMGGVGVVRSAFDAALSAMGQAEMRAMRINSAIGTDEGAVLPRDESPLYGPFLTSPEHAPGPASSRDVEVLRRLLRRLTDAADATPDDPEIAALSAAISALEEKEASGAVAVCMTCRHPLKRYGCEVQACAVLKAKPAKSSSDSMEERIRALEGLLRDIDMGAMFALRDPEADLSAAARSTLKAQRFYINAALHPHQSWCRGDHSEGACQRDASEVDHE